jgi:hypothetical protein
MCTRQYETTVHNASRTPRCRQYQACAVHTHSTAGAPRERKPGCVQRRQQQPVSDAVLLLLLLRPALLLLLFRP